MNYQVKINNLCKAMGTDASAYECENGFPDHSYPLRLPVNGQKDIIGIVQALYKDILLPNMDVYVKWKGILKYPELDEPLPRGMDLVNTYGKLPSEGVLHPVSSANINVVSLVLRQSVRNIETGLENALALVHQNVMYPRTTVTVRTPWNALFDSPYHDMPSIMIDSAENNACSDVNVYAYNPDTLVDAVARIENFGD